MNNHVQESSPSVMSRPKRKKGHPERHGYCLNRAIRFDNTTSDQLSISKAIEAFPRKLCFYCERAISDEFLNLEKKKAWKQVKIASAKKIKPLSTHAVLKTKRDKSGTPSTFKDRVVAGGNFQIQERDFDTVWGPADDFTLVLLTLRMSLSCGWNARQVDVKDAFLKSDVEREIDVWHPYNVPDQLQRPFVYKPFKLLHGLRQAPLQWFLNLTETLLTKLSFTRLKSDSAVSI